MHYRLQSTTQNCDISFTDALRQNKISLILGLNMIKIHKKNQQVKKEEKWECKY